VEGWGRIRNVVFKSDAHCGDFGYFIPKRRDMQACSKLTNLNKVCVLFNVKHVFLCGILRKDVIRDKEERKTWIACL